MKLPTIVVRFLRAVECRDLDAVTACFAVDATWQNAPHRAAIGRVGIRAMLVPIPERSTEVRWDVVAAAYQERRAWLERVDKF